MMLSGTIDGRYDAGARTGFSVEAVQLSARVNVRCVTPLGEGVASIA
jgi:hypothetical protein